MTKDALIGEIEVAWRRPHAAAEDLARADRELAEHVRGVRLANAEAFLKAKYGRTTSFYPDGLLDTHGHCRLEADSDRLGT